MKTNLHRILGVLMFASVLAMASCAKTEDDINSGNPDNPDISVPDPEGTITLSMRNANSGKTYLDDSNMYIDKADNFTGGYFVSLGSMRGLGNVTRIPGSGWTSTLAVVPGEGYVAYSNSRFYRIYVTGYTLNVMNEIIGAEVKYQTPFVGSGTITLDEEDRELVFLSEGGSRTVIFSNNEIVPFSVTSDICDVTRHYVENFSFLSNGIVVTAPENKSSEIVTGNITIEVSNGQTINLPVSILPEEPYFIFGGFSTTAGYNIVDASAQMQDAYVRTNIAYDKIKLSSSESWCSAYLYSEVIGNVTFDYVCYSFLENTGSSDRKATVTAALENGTVLNELTVTQLKPSISISCESTELSSSALTDYPVCSVVTSSSTWSVKSDQSWMKVSKKENSDKIFATVEENVSGMDRKALITVQVGDNGVSSSVEITQRPHTFGLSAESVNFDRQQGNASVTLTTSAAQFSAKSSDESWCTLSWNQNVMTVRVAANDTSIDRTATISVTINDGRKKDITVNQSRYAVGDYYDVGGVQGVIFLLDGIHGKIVSMDETETAWSKEKVSIGATDDNDGTKNMAVVKSIPNWKTLYPAFEWSDAKNTGGVTGWYLPAVNELKSLFQETTAVNEGLSANGGSEIYRNSYYKYWSSTENGYDYAYYYYYGCPSLRYVSDKVYSYYVRAVYAF